MDDVTGETMSTRFVERPDPEIIDDNDLEDYDKIMEESHL